MNASVSKVESFSTIDGPGIRTVIFFNGCNLRCKYCHNPETWIKKEDNFSKKELLNKILRNKPYFQNNGGITFSGGEPLLQYDFLINICKDLKKENIHIAIDTAGIGKGNYKELLDIVDLIILDIKSITKEGFIDITQTNNINIAEDFIKDLNNSKKDVWIRQVVIPGINDTKEYMINLANYIKTNLKNVKKIELLPFHTMAFEKYENLKMKNPYKNKSAMDKEKCNELYSILLKEYQKGH